MSPNRRWAIWLSLLAASAGLIAFDRRNPQDTEVVQASAPPATREGQEAKARTETAADAPMILAIRPRSPSEKFEDTFAAVDWTPPPPPEPPAPPPSAPPLPFTVLGKKLEDGTWQVFLGRQNLVFPVKQQDTIENTYRIDEIRPPIMTLTYLPLNQRQTLSIGGGE